MARDVVQEFANEAIGAQTAIHDALLKFSEIGLAKEKIRTAEIVYFALTLTICSLFRWGHFNDAPALADSLSDQVLRLNLESNAIRSRSEAIKIYRIRFSEYRAALPSLTDDQVGFGLLLSKNITGEDDVLIGTVLCAVTTIILGELKNLIEDMC
jgi:hypothetical protein